MKIETELFDHSMKYYLPTLTFLVLFAVSHRSASSAELTGKVTLKGTPKPEVDIPLGDICGKLNPNKATTRHYMIGKDAALANVFVYLKDAKAGFSSLVDDVMKGDFVTITRHGKPVAALVSIVAGELVRKALERKRAGFVDYLKTIPVDVFGRNASPSRDVDL